MSANAVYGSPNIPSPLPPLPGPGQTTTVVGPPPQQGGTLPETGFELLALVGFVIVFSALAVLCAIRAKSNRDGDR